ncbi:MAG: hypothetical protein M9927_11995 [Anaerolineae bacterium]|nr:hypothetical protein [Anaerolineae bacterium]
MTALRIGALQRWLGAVFLLAAAMMAVTLLNRPTLSDDMYRYVWEGRVQANGFSPYRYPPNALNSAACKMASSGRTSTASPM